MASDRLSYWDYVKAAFRRRLPVRGLGAMPVNQMALAAFGVLGIANPGFWLLGAAGELAYLAALSSSRRFQKLVQGERLQATQQGWEGRIQETVDRLSPESRERYGRLLGQCRRILGVSAALDGDSLGGMSDLRTHSLNQLLTISLRLLTSKDVTIRNLRGLDPVALARELRQTEERQAGLDPDRDRALVRSLEGTREIVRRRLENFEAGKSNLQVIEAELGRIEQQVELIREEAAVSGSPQILSARLDAVTSTISETSQWMDQHTELFADGAEDTPGLAELPPPPALPEG